MKKHIGLYMKTFIIGIALTVVGVNANANTGIKQAAGLGRGIPDHRYPPDGPLCFTGVHRGGSGSLSHKGVGAD
jgi:hypothetical protein